MNRQINRLFLVLTLMIAQAIPVTAESREKELDRWMEKDLIPHIREQLLVHPRFKGETVMFVVLEDNAPTPVTNALALSLRDQMLDAAINTAGVSVAWRQGRRPAVPLQARTDCDDDAVHYYIGIELEQELDSRYSVSVRALDLEDRSWVAGFGRTWRGELRTIQRQAFRQMRVDTTFRGSRDVPFSAAEADLLARHLARELACAVSRGTAGRYVVTAENTAADGRGLAGTVELVGQNLVGRNAVDLAPRAGAQNAILRGKAHRIDGPLYQYWLTVSPVDAESGLATLSSSAYVLLPDAATTPVFDQSVPATTKPASARDGIVPGRDAGLLGPLRIEAATRPLDCGRYSNRVNTALPGTAAPCSVLEASLEADAIVFVLAHQANHGLVRLGDAACRKRTAARIATAGEAMRLPIPRVFAGNETEVTADWRIDAEADAYYVLATADARAARALANHIDRLPLKCDGRLRPGLEGEALSAWLGGLAALADTEAEAVDWQGLAVRDVL